MTEINTSGVERFSIERNENGLGFSNGIVPDDNGNYVSWTAYRALLARAEKAEAHADELNALLKEGIATDEDTRRQARNAALQEAAEIAFEADDCYLARHAILALIDAPDA